MKRGAVVVTVLAFARYTLAEPPRVQVECGTERCAVVVPEGATEVMLELGTKLSSMKKGAKVVGDGTAYKITSCDGEACARVPVGPSGWDLKGAKTDIHIDTIRIEDLLAKPTLGSMGPRITKRKLEAQYGPGTEPVPSPTLPAGTSPAVVLPPSGASTLPPTLAVGASGASSQTSEKAMAQPPIVGAGHAEIEVVGGVEQVAAVGQPTPHGPDDRAFADVVLVGDQCTGTLVAPTFVLTAAHCLPTDRVRFTARQDAPLVSMRVINSARHPDGLDVAVLRLEGPAPWSPRSMRDASMTQLPIGTLLLIGFGLDNPRRGAGFGVKRRVPVLVSGWGCDGSRAHTVGCSPSSEMVIPPMSGRDTCDGDSGGPVLEWTGSTWRLIAITSRPTNVTRSACGRGGIYVRADAIAKWFTEYMRGAK